MWWDSQTGLQQAMFIIGCAMGIFLVIQIVMMLIGLENDSSFDGDMDFDLDGADSDPFNDGGGVTIFGLRLLSLRAIVAFFTIGSWVTYTLSFGLPNWGSILLGIVCGLGAAILMAYVLKAIDKLQAAGNINLKNAVGIVGEAYLRIPASRSGKGKVHINIENRYREYDAMTDSKELIKTGAPIIVVDVIGDDILMVEPHTK